jgi:phosphoribosyl-AMP cyclohydrolase
MTGNKFRLIDAPWRADFALKTGIEKGIEVMIALNLNFEKMGGLVPAVVQDDQSGEVLMVGFMNQRAWQTTLNTGKATFYSRTRDSLWTKGLTSGNVQLVKEIRIDCDQDTVLLKVEQVGGAACHTGHRSCFYQRLDADQQIEIVGEPVFDPKEVYKK